MIQTLKSNGLKTMALALVAFGCSNNNNPSPLGMGPLTNGTTYYYVNQASGPNVLFNPVGPAPAAATLWGGPIQYSYGGSSYVVTGTSGGNYRRNSAAAGDPALVVESSPNVDINFQTGGVGGPTDYFVRWKGVKGPDASLDYSSMTLFFQGTTANVDISGYRGFTFYARGNGNFGVSIAAGAPPSGQPGPYSGYNFYEYVFGPELKGDTVKWRQFSIEFSQMQQLFGQAVDINQVLRKSWGLQFQQEPPLTSSFQLDVDYVRFY